MGRRGHRPGPLGHHPLSRRGTSHPPSEHRRDSLARDNPKRHPTVGPWERTREEQLDSCERGQEAACMRGMVPKGGEVAGWNKLMGRQGREARLGAGHESEEAARMGPRNTIQPLWPPRQPFSQSPHHSARAATQGGYWQQAGKSSIANMPPLTRARASSKLDSMSEPPTGRAEPGAGENAREGTQQGRGSAHHGLAERPKGTTLLGADGRFPSNRQLWSAWELPACH